MIGAYIFPFFAHFIYTFVALMQLDILSMLAAFVGSFIVGAMVFFPFFCVYYAALAFIHTLLDEILFLRLSPKWLSIPFILISFASSAFLALNSMLAFHYFDHEWSWIPLVLMLLGIIISFFVSVILLEIRIVRFIVPFCEDFLS